MADSYPENIASEGEEDVEDPAVEDMAEEEEQYGRAEAEEPE
jgi:hypothetical protein